MNRLVRALFLLVLALALVLYGHPKAQGLSAPPTSGKVFTYGEVEDLMPDKLLVGGIEVSLPRGVPPGLERGDIVSLRVREEGGRLVLEDLHVHRRQRAVYLISALALPLTFIALRSEFTFDPERLEFKRRL